MRWLMLAFLFAAGPALPCSCSSHEPTPACQAMPQSEVVLRAVVVDHNDDANEAPALYRFEVREVFKGLPPDTKYVFVDPCSNTSCRTSFDRNREYLLYLGKALRRFSDHPRNLAGLPIPLLPAWLGSGDAPVFVSCMCSPTRELKQDDPELDYLRGRVKNGGRGWIYGRVIQNAYSFKPVAEQVPVEGAGIAARVRGGDSVLETRSGKDGIFRLDVPPGTYEISATKDGFIPYRPRSSQWTSYPVAADGCLVINPSLGTTNSISGQVFSSDGSPPQRTSVQAAIWNDGRWKTLGESRSTDSSGRFVLKRLPTGRIVIGVNIDRAPDKYQPFDTVYAPGTTASDEARAFDLGTDTTVEDVRIQLPKPLGFEELEIAVFWPDGSPAIGARGSADWKGRRSAAENARPDTHVVGLPLVPGREYEVYADWILPRSTRFWITYSPKLKVDFKQGGQRVNLILKENPPTRN